VSMLMGSRYVRIVPLPSAPGAIRSRSQE